MPDSLLQAIINGGPLDLPGLGSNDNGMTILFPLSFGSTVNDLAIALNLPVNSILAVNPGLQANSPLSVSQVVGLPDDRIEQIVQSVNALGGHAYVPQRDTSPPSPTAQETTRSSGVTPSDYVDQTLNDHANVLMPTLRALANELALLDHPKQVAVLVPLVEDDAQGWVARAGTYSLSMAGMSGEAPSVTSTANRSLETTSLRGEPVAASTATASATVSPAASGSDNLTVTAAGQRTNQLDALLNGAQAASVMARSAQDRQRNPGTDVPPPPMDPRWFAVPITSPAMTGAHVTPVVVVTHAVNGPSSPTALQLMALLMAQSGGSLAAGAAPVTPQQAQPYIDPQALAAFAAAMRAVRVVDLGAGRSMEFSLVRDRLQRIDPIGQEGRAASGRRTSDGLEEVRVSRPGRDDVEQSDEQREQNRRRCAAIAAMRRRRRARTRRCRYWRGARSIRRASSDGRYPTWIDWAEFRSRQLPRYR